MTPYILILTITLTAEEKENARALGMELSNTLYPLLAKEREGIQPVQLDVTLHDPADKDPSEPSTENDLVN